MFSEPLSVPFTSHKGRLQGFLQGSPRGLELASGYETSFCCGGACSGMIKYPCNLLVVSKEYRKMESRDHYDITAEFHDGEKQRLKQGIT